MCMQICSLTDKTPQPHVGLVLQMVYMHTCHSGHGSLRVVSGAQQPIGLHPASPHVCDTCARALRGVLKSIVLVSPQPTQSLFRPSKGITIALLTGYITHPSNGCSMTISSDTPFTARSTRSTLLDMASNITVPLHIQGLCHPCQLVLQLKASTHLSAHLSRNMPRSEDGTVSAESQSPSPLPNYSVALHSQMPLSSQSVDGRLHTWLRLQGAQVQVGARVLAVPSEVLYPGHAESGTTKRMSVLVMDPRKSNGRPIVVCSSAEPILLLRSEENASEISEVRLIGGTALAPLSTDPKASLADGASAQRGRAVLIQVFPRDPAESDLHSLFVDLDRMMQGTTALVDAAESQDPGDQLDLHHFTASWDASLHKYWKDRWSSPIQGSWVHMLVPKVTNGTYLEQAFHSAAGPDCPSQWHNLIRDDVVVPSTRE